MMNSDGGNFRGALLMQQSINNDLSIVCDACGTSQLRNLDWLNEATHLLCSGCGNRVDLQKEPWKGEIQRLWNAAHDRGPLRRRLP